MGFPPLSLPLSRLSADCGIEPRLNQLLQNDSSGLPETPRSDPKPKHYVKWAVLIERMVCHTASRDKGYNVKTRRRKTKRSRQQADVITTALRLLVVGNAELSQLAPRKLTLCHATGVASINVVRIGTANHYWVELVRKPGFAPGPSASRAEMLLLHHNPDGASGRTRTECLRTATKRVCETRPLICWGTEAKWRPRQESHLRPPPSHGGALI